MKLAFGHIDPAAITKTDGYTYLDACVQAGRPEKGNKEIAMLQVILEYGVRIGRIITSPLMRIRKNQTVKKRRHIIDSEMALALEVGRSKGGARWHLKPRGSAFVGLSRCEALRGIQSVMKGFCGRFDVRVRQYARATLHQGRLESHVELLDDNVRERG